MSLALTELRYFIIPGEGVSGPFREVYNEAYRMWKDVWLQTFRELDGTDRIYSDDFTRQSHVGAIFYRAECVAMTVFHEVDFSSPAARDDSYFKAWPDEAIQKLTEDGPGVLICSHLTVAPKFRGEIQPGTTFKQLLTELSVLNMVESGLPVMTGTMRKNRGADRAAYAGGASPILPNVELHGVGVDLVGFYRKEIVGNPEVVPHVWTQQLWRQREDLRAGQAQSITKIQTA